jgi:hypothetical protein
MSYQLLENASQLLLAIDHCASGGYNTARLMLIYCTIDIMAWLDRPAGKEDSSRDDFENWVARYLLPGPGLMCTPTDLYAARCSAVHAAGAGSRLVREGKARDVFYAVGKGSVAALENAIDAKKVPAVAVHLDTLTRALKNAVRLFVDSLLNDKDRAKLVHGRADCFFRAIVPDNLRSA